MAAEQGLLDGSGQPAPEPTAARASRPRRSRFADGQRVRVGNPVTPMHTRVPRYVRNHEGTVVTPVVRLVAPDRARRRPGRHGPMEHVYAVEFDGQELFGPGADHRLVVDVWETRPGGGT